MIQVYKSSTFFIVNFITNVYEMQRKQTFNCIFVCLLKGYRLTRTLFVCFTHFNLKKTRFWNGQLCKLMKKVHDYEEFSNSDRLLYTYYIEVFHKSMHSLKALSLYGLSI